MCRGVTVNEKAQSTDSGIFMELVDCLRANHYLKTRPHPPRFHPNSSSIGFNSARSIRALAPEEVCMKVKRNCVVAIQYILKDDAGTVIDSSEGREPLQYLHGNDNLIPGLEKALEGLEAGKQIHVTIPPEEGYGLRNPAMVQEVPKHLFEGEKVEPGMQFQVQAEDGFHILTIAEVRDNVVVVDGNHPLAGVNLNFDVTVVSVREASPEEIAHGHVH
jgi:FKBP-type peptidyl-prolyl cis-trans isomerase SlyD